MILFQQPYYKIIVKEPRVCCWPKHCSLYMVIIYVPGKKLRSDKLLLAEAPLRLCGLGSTASFYLLV